ncbi:thiamine phosphate synthase [soil metagenome]
MTAAPLAQRLSLVVLTDPSCGRGRTIVDVVRASLQGGAPAIQLRAKGQQSREVLELARVLCRETRAVGALLFVNDRVDVALAAGADGVHLGDDDLPLQAARRITPPGFLVGRSVDTPREAEIAATEGADYIGVGPVYGTPSKADAGEPIGAEGIRRVREITRIPIVAIGGLDECNCSEAVAAGADGIAVIRAVMMAVDPTETTRRLLAAVGRGGAHRR